MPKITGKITTERHIFVFGSNREGRHGKGAALTARNKWGAVYGQSKGLQGDSYAIVTKELRASQPPVAIQEIKEQVDVFLLFALNNPTWKFYVCPIGCGLAGFKPSQIAPMFQSAPRNCVLPMEFLTGMCKACEGSGKNSKGRECQPCAGTGVQSKGKVT